MKVICLPFLFIFIFTSCGTEVGNGIFRKQAKYEDQGEDGDNSPTVDNAGGEPVSEVDPESDKDNLSSLPEDWPLHIANTCASPMIAGALGQYESEAASGLSFQIEAVDDASSRLIADDSSYVLSADDSTEEPFDGIAVDFEPLTVECLETDYSSEDERFFILSIDDSQSLISWKQQEGAITEISLNQVIFTLSED